MKIFIRTVLVLALVTSLFAQQPAKDQPVKKDSAETREPAAQDSFYKLSFSVYELENGKRINQRDYMMIGKTNSPGGSSIRIATRVPFYVEENKMQYLDVGLNLRCPVKEQGLSKVQVECDIEMSSFIHPEQLAASGSNSSSGHTAPVLRSTRTSSWALLSLGKPAVMATLDDINSAKHMQIEVTATRVD
jgi:hypothetical protein